MDSPNRPTGRLSTLAAAYVVARRDFVAILWSRSFIFFLLGPLFPLLVGTLAAARATLEQRPRPVAGEEEDGRGRDDDPGRHHALLPGDGHVHAHRREDR